MEIKGDGVSLDVYVCFIICFMEIQGLTQGMLSPASCYLFAERVSRRYYKTC